MKGSGQWLTIIPFLPVQFQDWQSTTHRHAEKFTSARKRLSLRNCADKIRENQHRRLCVSWPHSKRPSAEWRWNRYLTKLGRLKARHPLIRRQLLPPPRTTAMISGYDARAWQEMRQKSGQHLHNQGKSTPVRIEWRMRLMIWAECLNCWAQCLFAPPSLWECWRLSP